MLSTTFPKVTDGLPLFLFCNSGCHTNLLFLNCLSRFNTKIVCKKKRHKKCHFFNSKGDKNAVQELRCSYFQRIFW